MSDQKHVLGVGAGDLQSAVSRESARIVREAKGDRLKASKIILARLQKMGFISDAEVPVLGRICEEGFAASSGKKEASAAYHEVRKAYDKLLLDPGTSPVALAFASASAGSYVAVDASEGGGSTGVVYKKSGGNWQETLAGAGAAIGGILGGPAGAGLGTIIGGVTGKIVDECL